MIRPWPVRQTRTLIDNRIFKLTGRLSRSPRTGDEHEFYVLQCTDWVNVVPLTQERQVILVRQYRHGTMKNTLEIPGGMVDPNDRDPGEGARRELLEETGYRAGEVQLIGAIAPNPAIQDNICHSFVATDLTYEGPPQQDGTEDIEVLQVPLVDIPQMIRAGEIDHALVVVAFCYLMGLGEGDDFESPPTT